jgi:hypothetical protein
VAPANAAVKMEVFHESDDFRALANYNLEALEVKQWKYGHAWPISLVVTTFGIKEIGESKCIVIFSIYTVTCC